MYQVKSTLLQITKEWGGGEEGEEGEEEEGEEEEEEEEGGDII